MKPISFFLLLFWSVFLNAQKPNIYPLTERDSVVDTIWNKTVADPYRWLENVHSDKTNLWLESQAEIRDKYASKLTYSVAEHLTNYSRIQMKRVNKEGKYYFSYGSSTLLETASLYIRSHADEQPKLLFNPNTLEKGVAITIDGIDISEDNKTLAIILSRNGSDWKTIRFLDLEKKELLNDSVNFVKYSPLYWSGDKVFYIKYDVKDVSESFSGLIKIKALQYHTLGTSQDQDTPVYTPESLTDYFSFKITPEKKYLIFTQKFKKGEKFSITCSYKTLPLNPDEDFKIFIDTEVKDGVNIHAVGEINGKLLVATNKFGNNGSAYRCDLNKKNDFEKFIPQYKERLQSVVIINENKILTLYNGDKKSYALIADSTGNKLKSWSIPEGYSFNGFSYTRGDSILVYYFNSFFSPSSVYQINLNTFEQTSLSKTIVPFSFKDLTTEMVYYYSKDSTLIPMYLTYKKGIKLNGNNPTILYGYGGFGNSMQPNFDVNNIAFLNSGGIFAVPKLRGGGDFPGWHEAGKRFKKQNTFDDFIAAAEYLIAQKYTNSEKLAAMGGSNGGLLVGACMTQRPELFKVVVSQSGVLDMLRYHKFNVGYKYTEEYGNIEDSLDFLNLLSYSPVHNVKSGVDYPATLLVASDNDDRVSPFHSFKFLSQLQTYGGTKNPYVLYYQEQAGHSGSGVFDNQITRKAYVYTFIYKYLGIESKIYFED